MESADKSITTIKPEVSDSMSSGIGWNFMDEDLTQNLHLKMQFIDREATEKVKQEPKYKVFKQWLLDHGAVFDNLIEYPCVF